MFIKEELSAEIEIAYNKINNFLTSLVFSCATILKYEVVMSSSAL